MTPGGVLDRILLGLQQPLAEIMIHAGSRTYWLYLLSGLALAYLVFRWRGGARALPDFFRFAFPKRIWTHRSARVDLWLIFGNSLLFVFAGGALLLSQTWVAQEALRLTYSLGWWDGSAPSGAVAVWVLFAYTLCLFLADDFMHFYMHYLQHRVPVLWEFHKVHHSAEVLTPFTADRFHPLDIAMVTAGKATALGLVTFSFIWLAPGGLDSWKVAGASGLLVLFNLAGGALRHSHIWLDFGPKVDRWLISPAMHQIHHSCEERHWDRNMGGTLSLWDHWFGTLYVPHGQERFALGCGPGTDRFQSLFHCYFGPFFALADRFSKKAQLNREGLSKR
jgi:sterol desaturase/sphingolipid hydroxylase (fatty acid hydroxylase superfamily)